MGQMAITKSDWADFVVYSANLIAIERTYFDEEEWKGMKVKLDDFYFMQMLPYIARKQPDSSKGTVNDLTSTVPWNASYRLCRLTVSVAS